MNDSTTSEVKADSEVINFDSSKQRKRDLTSSTHNDPQSSRFANATCVIYKYVLLRCNYYNKRILLRCSS